MTVGRRIVSFSSFALKYLRQVAFYAHREDPRHWPEIAFLALRYLFRQQGRSRLSACLDSQLKGAVRKASILWRKSGSRSFDRGRHGVKWTAILEAGDYIFVAASVFDMEAEDRTIAILQAQGASVKEIGRLLGKSPSTIRRRFERMESSLSYEAWEKIVENFRDHASFCERRPVGHQGSGLHAHQPILSAPATGYPSARRALRKGS